MRNLLRTLTCSAALATLVLSAGASVPAFAGTEGPSAAHTSAQVAIGADLAALDAVSAARLNPVRAARLLAYVSMGMVRAAHVRPAPELAVAVAAAEIIGGLAPAPSSRAEELVDRTRAELAGQGLVAQLLDRAEQRAVGVAEELLERAANDGADAGTVSPPPPTYVGAWQPTPPGFLPPVEPTAGTWRTWHLPRGDAYRPPPPPRPGDASYADQVAEVYDVARHLTPEQAAIARFWADGPGTVTPPGHWNLIALDLLRDRPAPPNRVTRILSALNTAQADAFIARWDAKYAYYSERPVTAIRRDIDPQFLPLLTTPPFPSYVSGHSTTSAAAATVLGRFFPADRAQLQTWAGEAAVSRLYGGIHFAVDNEAGLRLGRLVGRSALAHLGLSPR